MIAACALLAVFVALLGHAVLESLREKKKDGDFYEAVDRKQRRLGVYERIDGDVIAKRRR